MYILRCVFFLSSSIDFATVQLAHLHRQPPVARTRRIRAQLQGRPNTRPSTLPVRQTIHERHRPGARPRQHRVRHHVQRARAPHLSAEPPGDSHRAGHAVFGVRMGPASQRRRRRRRRRGAGRHHVESVANRLGADNVARRLHEGQRRRTGVDVVRR